MFDSKYIITTIITLLLIAAWQKPALYREHLAKPVVYISVFLSFVIVIWTGAMNTAKNVLLRSLPSEFEQAIIDAIELKRVSTVLATFAFGMIFGGAFLGWLAEAVEKHDKNNPKK